MDMPSEISSEAIATLLAGISAVVGAVIVGLRQTRILDYQSKLEERKFQSDLFDRRYDVYLATEYYLDLVLHGGLIVGNEARDAFGAAKNKSKFLFANQVHQNLNKLDELMIQYYHLARQSESLLHKGRAVNQDDLDRQERCHVTLVQTRLNLADIFGDEMSVTGKPFKKRDVTLFKSEHKS